MSYQVKEIFYTLQGEGFHAGRPAVFCRFSGCNLWSGREIDRASAICQFCDTDFVGIDGEGGGKFIDAVSLASAIDAVWGPNNFEHRFVVLTGGEPLLQIDDDLVNELHTKKFEIAVETNGTINPPIGIDWICVSPKAGSKVILKSGNELKVVIPQQLNLNLLNEWDFEHYFVQAMDGVHNSENLSAAIDWCLSNPKWKLSVQTHKVIGIK